MAGIESSAKSRSVLPSAMITISIGVINRLPFSITKSFVPWKSSVEGKRFLTKRSAGLSGASSSCSSWWR